MLDRPSRTAEQVALTRAVESARRGPRLFRDPHAAAFLRPRWRLLAALAALPLIGRGVERYLNWAQPPGPRASTVIRTRLIDDLVTMALRDGAQQLLLLGAGYDCRPYRLSGMTGTRVLEVDHPATQRRKREILGRRIGADRLADIRFVPVDLAREDLDSTLRRAGFEPVRTVVIWEGVVSYLTADAVDRVLRWMAGSTAPGSRIIFSYLDRDVVFPAGNGSRDSGAWADSVRRIGEPFTFGFDPDRLAGELQDRGLRLTVHLSATEAAERYLPPLRRREPTARFSRVAQAEVPLPEGEPTR